MSRSVRACCIFLVFIGVLLLAFALLMRIADPASDWWDFLKMLAAAGFCFRLVWQVKRTPEGAILGEYHPLSTIGKKDEDRR